MVITSDFDSDNLSSILSGTFFIQNLSIVLIIMQKFRF